MKIRFCIDIMMSAISVSSSKCFLQKKLLAVKAVNPEVPDLGSVHITPPYLQRFPTRGLFHHFHT